MLNHFHLDVKNEELIDLIIRTAEMFFGSDQNCDFEFEPSDLFSPCLQEADLMSRIAEKNQFSDFEIWLQKFLPKFKDDNFDLEPGISI